LEKQNEKALYEIYVNCFVLKTVFDFLTPQKVFEASAIDIVGIRRFSSFISVRANGALKLEGAIGIFKQLSCE
jgi:hypothetical protein